MTNLSYTSNGVNANNTFLMSIAAMNDLTRRDFKSFNKKILLRGDFERSICSQVWSPIIYSDGQRKRENFEMSGILALDFDSGEMTLDKMIDLIQGWECEAYIGLTKNHQKEKNGAPPCDRFRLIMPLFEPTADRELYEYNFRMWVHNFPADKSVKDGARYFYPCTSIYFSQLGERIELNSLPDNYLREPELQKMIAQQSHDFRNKGQIPPWIIRDCRFGVAQGGRHLRCFVIGRILGAIGYGDTEIADLVLGGPLAEIGEHDVRRAVQCGAKKGREIDRFVAGREEHDRSQQEQGTGDAPQEFRA